MIWILKTFYGIRDGYRRLKCRLRGHRWATSAPNRKVAGTWACSCCGKDWHDDMTKQLTEFQRDQRRKSDHG